MPRNLRAGVAVAAIGIMLVLLSSGVASSAHAAMLSADDEVAAATLGVLQAEPGAAVEGTGACVGEYMERPEGTLCVLLFSTPDQVASGLAYFSVGSAGFGGWADIVGRDPNGAWHLWISSQQHSAGDVALPRQLRVCTDGDTLNVRAQPSSDAPIVTVLQDQTLVNADTFVFTDPGTNQDAHAPGFQSGTGWFHLTLQGGWVLSSFVAPSPGPGFVAACVLHFP